MKLVLAKLKHRSVCLNIRKQFYCECDWGLAHIAQGGCRVSVLGETQNCLDTILGNWLSVALLEQNSWTRWPPEAPSNLSLCDFVARIPVNSIQGWKSPQTFYQFNCRILTRVYNLASAAQCCYGNNWLHHGQECNFPHHTLVIIRTTTSLTISTPKRPLDLEPPAAICIIGDQTDTLIFQARFG